MVLKSYSKILHDFISTSKFNVWGIITETFHFNGQQHEKHRPEPLQMQ